MSTGKTLPERSLGTQGFTAPIQVIGLLTVSADALDHRSHVLTVLLIDMPWFAFATFLSHLAGLSLNYVFHCAQLLIPQFSARFRSHSLLSAFCSQTFDLVFVGVVKVLHES